MCVRRATAVMPSNRQRSAISNGSRLLANVDARSAGARRFKDLVRSLSADLGENLSEADLALIRQAASLIQRGEQLQADIAAGRDVDAEVLTKLAGASRRSLAAISAKAVDRKQSGPTLADYMAAKTATADLEDGDDEET